MRRRSKEVCVDSNIAFQWVVKRVDSPQAFALLDDWTSKGIKCIAPPIFPLELDSTIRRSVVTRSKADQITPETAEAAFSMAQALPVEIVEVEGQRRRAWELARKLGQAVVYDTTYIALAELRRCEFWTADERIYNSATQAGLKYIHLLSQWQPQKGR